MWKWILHSFELWSGLKINCNKSHTIFMGRIDVNNLIIERIIGCPRGEFSIKYLGAP